MISARTRRCPSITSAAHGKKFPVYREILECAFVGFLDKDLAFRERDCRILSTKGQMLAEGTPLAMADVATASIEAVRMLSSDGDERLPAGASLYDLQVHSDDRGSLTALEAANLPFEPRRVFVVEMPHPGRSRAEHACSAEQVIVVLRGRAAFDVDDGCRRATLELTAGNRALRLRPGTWLRMIGRVPDTTLLVAASTTFAKTEYFRTAQPDLGTARLDGGSGQAALIAQADPAARLRLFETEVGAAIRRVIETGILVSGPAVDEFERAFARYVDVDHCVGVNSGTDALSLALRAVGVRAGDDVLTVSLSAAGTAQAVAHCGARPRFVDVDPTTFCMDLSAAEAAIGPTVKAIVPVHLYGRAADVRRLRALADHHGLALVEDCAQAHGATLDGRKLGTFGHAAAFSFYPTKNLGALGDGGAVVTDDVDIAVRVRSLSRHGWRDEVRVSHEIGLNSRLDEVQAAVLSVLLPHLDAANAARRQIAARYRSKLASVDIGLPSDDPGGVYHQFAVTSPRRDILRRFLADKGIGTAVHYAPPLHRHPAFANASGAHLPVTERLSATLLSLPIQPEVAEATVERIADAMIEFCRS